MVICIDLWNIERHTLCGKNYRISLRFLQNLKRNFLKKTGNVIICQDGYSFVTTEHNHFPLNYETGPTVFVYSTLHPFVVKGIMKY